MRVVSPLGTTPDTVASLAKRRSSLGGPASRQAAARGKTGRLPIEQPTKFELVLNHKVAKTLGVTVPPWVRLRADHVIE